MSSKGSAAFAARAMAAGTGGWTRELEDLVASARPVTDTAGTVQRFARPSPQSLAPPPSLAPAGVRHGDGALADLVREREEVDRAAEMAEALWLQADAATFGAWDLALGEAGLAASPATLRPRVEALRQVARDGHAVLAAGGVGPAEALVALHAAFHHVVVLPLKAQGMLVAA